MTAPIFFSFSVYCFLSLQFFLTYTNQPKVLVSRGSYSVFITTNVLFNMGSKIERKHKEVCWRWNRNGVTEMRVWATLRSQVLWPCFVKYFDLFAFYGGRVIAPLDQGLLNHDVSISHTTTNHSRQDSSGRVISQLQKLLPANTQHSQQTNIHASGGVRTHNLSRRTAADLRLRPRGHWDRLICLLCHS